MKLRKDQQQALRKTIAGLKRSRRGQILAPCGWGKSAVQPLIMHRLKARTTVVFVPSLRLVTQTAGFWLKNAPFAFDLLLVCSRADARLDEDIPDFEGFDVTTDPDEVQAFLRKRGRRVVFCTYQSAHVLQECQRFGLGIFDEAHHTAGSTDKSWSIGLDDQNIAIKKRLFMTATPRIVDVDDDSVYSMEDEENYGKVLYEMSFMEAVEKKIVVPYQVVVIASAPKEAVALLPAKGKDDQYDMRTECGVRILKLARRRYGFKRTISFHSRVSRATAAATRGQELNPSMAWHVVSAKSSRHDRVEGERILASRRGGVVTNVRCLAEGIDIRDVDSVAFLDPRQSVVDIVQAVGRAMRTPAKHPKKMAYIVIPILAEGDDVEDMKGAFKNLGKIINAMIAIDETIVDYLRELAIGGSSGKAHNPLIIDVPGGVDTDFAKAITMKILRIGGADWWVHYAKLKTFVEMKGHYPSAAAKDLEQANLGKWASTQRMKRVERTYSSLSRGHRTVPPHTRERHKALENLPQWSWNTVDDTQARVTARAKQLLGHYQRHRSWPKSDSELGKFRYQVLREDTQIQDLSLVKQLRELGCFDGQRESKTRGRLEALLKTIRENDGVPPTISNNMMKHLRAGGYSKHSKLVNEIRSTIKLSKRGLMSLRMSAAKDTRFLGLLISFVKMEKRLPRRENNRNLFGMVQRRKREWATKPTKDLEKHVDCIKQMEAVCARYVKGYVCGETMFDKVTLRKAGFKQRARRKE